MNSEGIALTTLTILQFLEGTVINQTIMAWVKESILMNILPLADDWMEPKKDPTLFKGASGFLYVLLLLENRIESTEV